MTYSTDVCRFLGCENHPTRKVTMTFDAEENKVINVCDAHYEIKREDGTPFFEEYVESVEMLVVVPQQ